MAVADELSFQSMMKVLQRGPHKGRRRSKTLIADFERFLSIIEKEHQPEAEEEFRDASSQHDKYLYG